VAYLAKPTAAKRTAYLRAIGLVQGFQALDLLDRDAVKSGWPSVGMRTEARRFVWGDPSADDSDARRSPPFCPLALSGFVLCLWAPEP